MKRAKETNLNARKESKMKPKLGYTGIDCFPPETFVSNPLTGCPTDNGRCFVGLGDCWSAQQMHRYGYDFLPRFWPDRMKQLKKTPPERGKPVVMCWQGDLLAPRMRTLSYYDKTLPSKIRSEGMMNNKAACQLLFDITGDAGLMAFFLSKFSELYKEFHLAGSAWHGTTANTSKDLLRIRNLENIPNPFVFMEPFASNNDWSHSQIKELITILRGIGARWLVIGWKKIGTLKKLSYPDIPSIRQISERAEDAGIPVYWKDNLYWPMKELKIPMKINRPKELQ